MTRISDLLSRGKTFSFEFFPPKTDQGFDNLREAIHELETLEPSFVSVTYGAGGSTREKTRDVVVDLIKNETSLEPMPHLTCVASKRDEIRAILEDYKAHGISNVLALHGDLPKDRADDAPPGELHRALELVELAREVDDYSIGVAAHPEGHPKAPDLETDRRHQAAKLEVADFGITQFFFEVEPYFRLLDELEQLGVTTPVIAGVIPITNVNQVERFAEMSGAEFPSWLAERLHAVADDEEEVRRIGVDVATDLSQRLLEGGAPGLHFYTLNRARATMEIYDSLGRRPATSVS